VRLRLSVFELRSDFGLRTSDFVIPRLASLATLLVLLASTIALPAAPSRQKARTAAELEEAKEFATPRAFAKGDNVRIYYTNETGRVVFVADWKKSAIQGRRYAYNNAELKFDRTPPKLPKPDGSWREAVVVGRGVWTRFATEAAGRLTPAIPGHGIYVQTLATESVLYRDATGTVKSSPFGSQPAEVVLATRYNTQEFAVLLAEFIEGRLRTGFPGKDLFLIEQQPEGQDTAFVLLDLARRMCVLLEPPRTADDPRGEPQFIPTVAAFGSLTVESHGVSMLKNPFSTTFRLAHTAAQSVAGFLTPRVSSSGPPPPVTNAPPMDLAEWEARLDELTDTRSDRGAVRFLINGEGFFPVLEERIATATNRIQIEVGIFDNDDVAVGLADQLRQSSRAVDVKVILDRMSTQASARYPPATPMPDGFKPPSSITDYLQGGSRVQVRPFLNPWLTSDHAKVISVDGWWSCLGGMNFGREYRYEWHDLMAEVEGPIVAKFQRDFAKAWAHAGPLGDAAYAMTTLLDSPPTSAAGPARDWPKLRRLYTRPGEIQIRKAVLAALNQARNRIYLENPYLYDPAVVNGLVRARARGVDVRVVLPSENDLGGGKSSNYVIANHLFRNGVRVYLYPGMTHVKALVTDGWCTFGSANFNKLSLRTNHEVNLATSDAGITGRLASDLFAVDFAKSHVLTEPIEVDWTDHLANTILSQF
jgi:phosphatidylserine/phosphatidylglycerophosphate/cardiolipin synthase-like enzyme